MSSISSVSFLHTDAFSPLTVQNQKDKGLSPLFAPATSNHRIEAQLLNEKATNSHIATIEERLEAFEAHLNKVYGDGGNIKRWSYANCSEITKLLLKEHRLQGTKEALLYPFKKINEKCGTLQEKIMTPDKMIHQLLEKEPHELFKAIDSYASFTSDATKLVITLGSALGGLSGLLFKKSIIDAVEQETGRLKKEGTLKKEDLCFLESWITQQRKQWKEEFNAICLDFSLYAPKGTRFIWGLFQKISTIPGLILSGITGGIWMTRKHWATRKKVSQEDLLNQWAIIWNKQVEKQLEKRKALAKKSKQLVEVDAAKEAIKTDELKKQETRSTLVRNALRTYETLKLQSESSWRKFSTNKALVDQFFISTFVLAGFALKIVAACTLFVAPTLLMATLGLVPFALSLSLSLAGGIYLYKKHPHLFSEIMRGVETRLACVEIPQAIQTWRLESKRLSQLVLAKKLKSVLAFQDVLTIKQRRTLAKNIKQWDALEESVAALEKKVRYWDARAEVLKKRLNQANSKDYEQSTQLSARALAGVLIEEPVLDAYTKETLDLRFGINIDPILALSSKVEKIQVLTEKFQTYLSKHDEEMVAFSKKQLERVKTSLKTA